MTGVWELPTEAVFDGNYYRLCTDFRDILEIFSYLNDPDMPEFLRWQIAVALFFEAPVESAHMQQAVEYHAWFIAGGEQQRNVPGPKLLDWEQDAAMIICDVNRAAGQELRSLPYLHWWTFLAYFHAIGEGQLSTVVSIRDKLSRGKQLEAWEKEYYRAHRCQVELPKRYTQQELEQRRQLEQLLKGR